MLKKALLGLVATCVYAGLSAHGALAGGTDIVLYATDATNLRGNWSRVADATAGGGQLLATADNGWSNTGAPQASPADSFDLTFNATSATSYHVWIRMRALGNSKYNDSMYVQFSDAVDAGGAPLYALGTTTGLTVNLAGDSTGKTISSWGWQDRAYWLTQPTTIRFAASGAHTVRFQTREDGVQIDQVVLSPTTYLTTAPGLLTNDTTIVPKSAVATLPAPWTGQDVGSTGLAGTSAYSGGLFTVAGAGADVWGSVDGFRFVSQPVAGDAEMVARVASLQNTNTYAKAGVMLRETSAAGSAHVLIDVRPNGSIELMTRTSTGASTTFLAAGTQPAPGWLKLSRSGATVTASVSADGSLWTTIGSTQATPGATALVGLAVTSHDTTQLNTVTFDSVSLTVPPTAPASPTPVAWATSVATNAPLAWSAAGATSYDVNFGATNPPARVATGVKTGSYAPTGLTAGTTYFWQVVARNVAGATAGPVWPFTTIVAPPTAPIAATPATGATGIATSTLLAWTANDAASYDVAFGTTNPPATVATGVTTPTFTPAALANNTTYYWQVVARNAGGATPGAVSSFTTIVAPPTATPYSGTPAAIPGTIQAANFDDGGEGVAYHDSSAGNSGGAYRPTDVDLQSSSEGGYNVGWTAANEWLNYTVAAASGGSYTAQFRVASPNGGAMHVGFNGPSNVWASVAIPATGGWQSWTTVNVPVTLGAGRQLMKLQFDTGGINILSVAIVVVSTPITPAVQLVYNAIIDRNAYPKPAVPLLGAAGYSFNDGTFGSKILRVTDGNTRPGLTNRSFRVPSNAHLAAWNASSTAFYVLSNDGTIIPYAFEPATMTASRMQPATAANGGLTLAFYVEPQFSLANPNVIYGAVSGANNRTIAQYDFSTGVYSTIVDLDTIVGGLAGTYVGGVMTGGTTAEKLLTFFGGASQDGHFYAMLAPANNPAARKILNTMASTINGAATNVTLNFKLHSMMIDKSGRFVFLYPTGADIAAPRSAAQVYVWDTDTDTVTAITSSLHNSGHDAAGHGYWINQDCCSSSSWDAAQWQFRSLTDVTRTSDLISPVLATKEVYLADHTSWMNARPDVLVPVISSTYRFGANTAAWRAWDDEIIGIDTTGGIGGIVYRFAHHRSNVGSDADPAQPYFWYQPIPNVSPDGKWVLFTSNWEKTLGKDASEGTFRQDVFVVQLTPQ